MNVELLQALNELVHDRGIDRQVVLDAIDAAIQQAYKRNYESDGGAPNIRVELDDHSGQLRVFVRKSVVEQPSKGKAEISLEDARRINPNYQLGDTVEVEIAPQELGRIAAQSAKQVVVQRIREAERQQIYEEFATKVDDIVNGAVQRRDQRNVYVDLGRIEGVLPAKEQMPGDHYRQGDRIKAYVTEVKKTPRGPMVMLSRTHPGLLRRLFELEVPEVYEGTVEIKAVAREPGHRSKIAVSSRVEDVDPVGACVGQRGRRVQSVVAELRGEKIDVVQWEEDPAKFVANALSPARVSEVYPDPTQGVARVLVSDTQLSLAIGKEGQNARLAAKLTGWRIDIKSESQRAELEAALEEQRKREAELAEARKKAAAARAAAPAEAVEPAVKPAEEPAAEGAVLPTPGREAPAAEVPKPAQTGVPAAPGQEPGAQPELAEAEAAGQKETLPVDADLLDSLLEELLSHEKPQGSAGQPQAEAGKGREPKAPAAKGKAKKEKTVLKGLDALEHLKEILQPEEKEGKPSDGGGPAENP